MKRTFKIFGIIASASALSFLSYLKGDFDGTERGLKDRLILNTIVFNDFRRSPDYARNRLGMLIAAGYDSLDSRSPRFQAWLNGRKETSWPQFEGRAAQIANQYRGKMPTMEEAKAALEKAFPDAKIEFKTE